MTRLPKRPRKQWDDDDGYYSDEEREKFLYKSAEEMRAINERAENRNKTASDNATEPKPPEKTVKSLFSEIPGIKCKYRGFRIELHPICNYIAPIRQAIRLAENFTKRNFAMTINELIERLEEYRNLHGEDCEVRLMTQQNWPFENTIIGLASADEMAAASGECEEDEEADECEEDEEADAIDSVVYLVEGSQIGYGSKLAWEAAY